ncbi:hypothetical protein HY480_04005 [Candidatus Uhrbacteria bacterium]|nr:hypothetical protein [Candidatus Uhrbacteria bacterium]
MGVRVQPFFLRKQWCLFGKKKWKTDHNPLFTLTPVTLSGRYDEIEVAIWYIYDVDQGGGEYVVTSPSAPAFAHIRSTFERILGDFYDHLQSQHA